MAKEMKLKAAGNKDFKVDAVGEVVGPGKAKPPVKLAGVGDLIVKIIAVDLENPEHPPEESENYMVKCEYPCGLVKHHQIPKNAVVGQLVTVVRNNIKSRYDNVVAGELKNENLERIEDLAGTSLVFSEGGNHDG